MVYVFFLALLTIPVSFFALAHAIKSLPGPTYPIEMARVLNGRKFRMERNLRGSFTSIYAYRSDGQKVWKSSPKFNSDVDSMTDAELDRWFNLAAAEYFADRLGNLCSTESSSHPE